MFERRTQSAITKSASRQLIRGVLGRADGAITTGGLGPTADDLTKEAVCTALGLGVELYEPALARMEALFASAGRMMPPNNRKQAELPRGSLPLENVHGTAPGFVAFGAGDKFVACLPGVPREMKPMLVEQLLPFLRARASGSQTIRTRVIHTINISESELDSRIDDLVRASENPKIAVLAHDFRVDVKVMAKAESGAAADAAIDPLARELERRLAGFVFGRDDTTPAGAVLEMLSARGERLAVAESYTGGRVAAALTSVPGASDSFVGGVVAYADAAKVSLLGVHTETLRREGAVSEAVAKAMATGARERFGADVTLATTGIAGPSGATPEKPVGLVWIALDDVRAGVRAWRFQLHGGREAIASRSVTIALGILWRHLRDAS